MLSGLRQAYAGKCSQQAFGRAGWLSARPFSAQPPAEDEIHNDFRPQHHTEPGSGVDAQIQDDITKHKVFLYMKGEPEAPMCGFSNMACKILNAYGVDFGSRDVLSDPDLREGVKKFSQWPTIPQVYVDGEFVGGSDILMGLHKSGELETLLSGASKA